MRSRKPRDPLYHTGGCGTVTRSVTRGGGLDLDIHAGRKAPLVEGVNRLVGRLNNVDQPLVRPDLELLPRLLIDVRAPEHSVTLDARGQRNRSVDDRLGALGGIDNVLR